MTTLVPNLYRPGTSTPGPGLDTMGVRPLSGQAPPFSAGAPIPPASPSPRAPYPPKPPYPVNPTPVPKPPVDGYVPEKPPYPEPEAPIPPADPSPRAPYPPKPPVSEPGVPPKPPYPEPVDPTKPTQPPPGTAGSQPPGTPGSLGLDFMRQVTPDELVRNQLQGLLDSNSPYMTNARLRGQEFANSRGMLNSSLAAGTSQRSALEAALPIAQSDADVYRAANEGNFQSLNQLRQMRTAAQLEDWLSSESYNRDFNGRLAMLPITNSMDMMSYIQQRALEDPSVYTPEVISGINNFWNQNMFDVLGNYFNIGGGGPNGG